MKFSVILPTYNRPADLKKCLESIKAQSVLPEEILIIDDGELAVDFIERTKRVSEKQSITIRYHKKDHQTHKRGLSESKNLGLHLAQSEIVFFLDDDLVLQPDFFHQIMGLWEDNASDPHLIGVGGVILNSRKKSALEKIYNKIFLLDSPISWDITSAGFQVWDDFLPKTAKGFYAHGGVCSFRKSEILKLGGFQTFSGGRTALEDVDFCLRAKHAGYFFMITPLAKTMHYHSKIGREAAFLSGMKESANRKLIYINHGKLDFYHRMEFAWANAGWVLRQFLVGHWAQGLGMLGGFFRKSSYNKLYV